MLPPLSYDLMTGQINVYHPCRRQSREGVGYSPPFVCLSVYPHDISKTDAARITKPDKEMYIVPRYLII